MRICAGRRWEDLAGLAIWLRLKSLPMRPFAVPLRRIAGWDFGEAPRNRYLPPAFGGSPDIPGRRRVQERRADSPAQELEDGQRVEVLWRSWETAAGPVEVLMG